MAGGCTYTIISREVTRLYYCPFTFFFKHSVSTDDRQTDSESKILNPQSSTGRRPSDSPIFDSCLMVPYCLIFRYIKPASKIMKILSVLTISSALLGTATAFVSPRRASGTTTAATALDATIAVFGASGLTASECVYQALRDGDKVVGLTRNPTKLLVPKGSGGADAEKPLYDHPNLTLIGGDVTNPADVAKGKTG